MEQEKKREVTIMDFLAKQLQGRDLRIQSGDLRTDHLDKDTYQRPYER